MKEKTIVSTATLMVSLLSYLYAKEAKKDAVPYVMLGGFVGAIKGCALDTTSMAPEAAQELERLYRDSGIAGSGEFLSENMMFLRDNKNCSKKLFL